MQRPVRGYRGGIRVGSRHTHTHRIKDDNDDDTRLSLSNSSSDEIEDNNNENDSTLKSKDSSILARITTSADIESAIRNFRPSKTRKKKTKTNPNFSGQKADLPQLNMISDKTNNPNEETKDKKSHHWFPKPDIGHVDSNDFIRHNHIGKLFLNTKRIILFFFRISTNN